MIVGLTLLFNPLITILCTCTKKNYIAFYTHDEPGKAHAKKNVHGFLFFSEKSIERLNVTKNTWSNDDIMYK